MILWTSIEASTAQCQVQLSHTLKHVQLSQPAKQRFAIIFLAFSSSHGAAINGFGFTFELQCQEKNLLLQGHQDPNSHN